ncbi:AmpG family muropeptide MFS transporter [Spiribacter vilamensis]|uniref:PAT family beta-lactamase induction signal transducer AmpG n=1 Tax=Spiribacter vilamensis TaxID=531306 RepID=A0A4Q8D220_9GAMM|nr:MFS transporter [Spiribacter vilamensis]RZU99330.1 PAT family beta-lactamase induction signal transducer AmpG [Spiribacter vilamensis]TVO61686.1 AmpG family muropeptide MFS transporter [Spiribacter vilamensis]
MEQTTKAARWREAVRVYRRPSVLAMLFLGFSAGLPFMLVFATLSAWLREMDVSRSAIGFFSWVGITYSIKFIWSPVIDRVPLPGLTRYLGRRRAWILLGQVGIATGLAGMAFADPATGLLPVALLALLVAFSSATQDVAIDAFRIECDIDRFQGALAAAYQLGYRVAILASYTGALYLADLVSWRVAYLTMAALMGIGMITVLWRPEPVSESDRRRRGDDEHARAFVARHPEMPGWLRESIAWLLSAVVAPVREFFSRFGRFALVMLALVASFRITDIAMASMANPLYIDLGYSKAVIANVSGAWGLGMTITGALLGGLLTARFGILRPLLGGAFLAAITNLLFAWMAGQGGATFALVLTISADNLSGGIAGSVFIAWLSSLTNTSYTATQYALFSSLMTLPGKFLSGFGGIVVDAINYPTFFVISALMGLPAVGLIIVIMKRESARGTVDAVTPSDGK